jgi:hypothetical protein
MCCLQINLFLRVVRRREDGYHDLASLFHVRVYAAQQAAAWQVPAPHFSQAKHPWAEWLW